MLEIFRDIPLGTYTTIRTGGSSAYYSSCKSTTELLELLSLANNRGLRTFILGGGSNVLVSDSGVSGLTIHMKISKIKFSSTGLVKVGAGVVWDDFVMESCVRGFAGLEAMSGIPGTVGATPIQNVGAYGQEVGQKITSVTAINRSSLEKRIFSNDECGFRYRSSRFKSKDANQWIITEVEFQLDCHNNPKPNYSELITKLESDPRWVQGSRLEKILAIRNNVIEIRKSKGMIVSLDDSDSRSVGSFFVNPIVSTETMLQINSVAHKIGSEIPIRWNRINDNMWKTSAASLIEQSGISKGFTLGNAKVSTKHVLAITNTGSATTSEILNLADFIVRKVRETFGVELVQEPVLVD